ncbi:carboxypeptidase regulatory-like domain-containing protein [Agromyces sp. ZXT2-6]|uniref:carboxypeptidase regulatory-like domain-containing protein n=1 Tax=Agromyces sp. ZXT2-6 TaxID=3461153 RepID=UPI004054ED03
MAPTFDATPRRGPPFDPNALETRLPGSAPRRSPARTLVRTVLAALLAAVLGASGIQAAVGQVTAGAEITGVITDPEGRPAPGVQVRMAWLDDAIHDTKYATSDSAGSYRFTGVEAGTYTMEFRPSGPFAWEWWGGTADAFSADRFDVGAGATVTGMDVRLSPEASMSGVVRGDGTTSVLFTELYLWVVGGDGELAYRGRELAGSDGTYRFDHLLAGSYTFAVVPRSSTPYAKEWWNDQPREESADLIDVSAGNAVTGLDVQLDPGASISGKLLNETGEPIPTEDVGLYEVAADGDRRVATAVSNSTGAFQFTRVPRGDYVVRTAVSEQTWYADEWWNDSVERATAEVIHVGKDEVITGIDLALPLQTSLSGYARGEAGEPVSGARVELHSMVDGEPVFKRVTESDATGAFAFMAMEPGPYTVRVEAPFGSPYADQWWNGQFDAASADTITLAALEQGRIDVEFLAGASISGRVSNEEGEPVADVRVSVHVADGDARRYVTEGRTAADGGYEFVGLEAGAYAVCFTPPNAANLLFECWDDRPDKSSANLIAVSLGDVAADRDVTLARGGSIVGELIGIDGKPLFNVLVQSYRQDATGWYRPSGSAYSDADGHYSLLSLVSGSYVLEFRPPPLSPYVREWWDDQTDSSYSTPIDVVAGQAKTGIDATLTRLVSLSTPALLGTATVGSTLTASTTTTDPEAELAYAWFADGVELVGQVDPTLDLTDDHLGTRISVRVTASMPGYVTQVHESSQTEVVTAMPQTDLSIPQVTGTTTVGSTLSAMAVSRTPGATLAYQWLADGHTMIDETAPILTLGAEALGRRISVRVTATAPGYASRSSESATTSQVLAGALDAAVPTIAGTPVSGATLTASAGTWTGGTSLTYQWFAGGKPIVGATGTTLALGTAEEDEPITVQVTGVKWGYTTVSKTSAPTAPVLRVASPSIGGDPIVGGTLTVRPGSWSSGTTFSYRWFADGITIPGVTGATLVLSGTHAGNEISVQLTGAKDGYPPVSMTSAPTAEVLPGSTSAIDATPSTDPRPIRQLVGP